MRGLQLAAQALAQVLLADLADAGLGKAGTSSMRSGTLNAASPQACRYCFSFSAEAPAGAG